MSVWLWLCGFATFNKRGRGGGSFPPPPPPSHDFVKKRAHIGDGVPGLGCCSPMLRDRWLFERLDYTTGVLSVSSLKLRHFIERGLFGHPGLGCFPHSISYLAMKLIQAGTPQSVIRELIKRSLVIRSLSYRENIILWNEAVFLIA